MPDGFMKGTPVHPEFEGYDQHKRPHINQADVALLQYPLGLRTEPRIFPALPGEQNPDQLAINDLLFWQPLHRCLRRNQPRISTKSDNTVFFTGDSAYSIAWLVTGKKRKKKSSVTGLPPTCSSTSRSPTSISEHSTSGRSATTSGTSCTAAASATSTLSPEPAASFRT